MIMIVPISAYRQYLNQEVTIRGRLAHKRACGRVRFGVIREETGLLQAIPFPRTLYRYYP